MEKITSAMKKLTIDRKPPPLKLCTGCRYNLGSDITGLCASCDVNHRWWVNSEKRINELQGR